MYSSVKRASENIAEVDKIFIREGVLYFWCLMHGANIGKHQRILDRLHQTKYIYCYPLLITGPLYGDHLKWKNAMTDL